MEEMHLEPGLEIAGATLIRLLGIGGQGQVWLGARSDGTQIAVKVLLGTRPDQILRAMREARLQAAVDSPHVVKLLDFRLVDHVPVIQSEYVEGVSLQQLLRQGDPSLDQIDRLAHDLFDGVEAAHALGLVHRDLKPANVLIEADGAQYRAKITDFGIAIESAPFRPGDELAGHGETVGTPGFIAPEQFLASEPVDTRADLFGLGAVLYWLVTGRRAFAGAHRAEVLARSASGTFTPVRTVAPDVPRAWARAIAWCLDPSPHRRPRDIHSLRRAWEGEAEAPDRGDDPIDPADDSVTDVGLQPDPSATAVGFSFGRHAELALMAARLQSHRVVTLRGFAGIGKSHLARLFAASRAGPKGRGSAVADLTEARTDSGLLIALAVGLRIALSGADPVDRLARLVSGRGPIVVVLDNAEQVLEPVRSLLPRLMQRAPLARFLVTSRRALDLPGEAVIDLGALDREAGVDLFVQRARQLRPAWTATSETRRALGQLVEALEGVPLAIELAAARIPEVTVAAMLDELARGDRPTARAPAMRVALRWSWDLLRPWEQRTLAATGVFHNGFTARAAEAVVDLTPWPGAPGVMEVVHRLVDHSLIQVREDRHGELRLHPYVAVQTFALDRLEPATLRDLRTAHATHYRQLGTPTGMRALYGPRGFEVHRRRLAEMENLAAALDFALEQELVESAVGCARALVWGIARIGPPQAGIDRVSRTVRLTGLTDRDRGRLLVDLAQLHREQGAASEARATLEEALELARTIGDRALQGEVLEQVGTLTHYEGDLSGAIPLYERALDCLERSRRPGTRVISVWRKLSSVLQHAGQFKAAERAAVTALDAARAERAVIEYASCQVQLGSLRSHQGRPAEALALEREALAAARQMGDRILEGRVLANLAIRLHQTGALDAAIATFERAAEIGRDTGGPSHEGVALTNLGEALMGAGRLDEAQDALERAIELGDASVPIIAGAARVTLARLLIDQQRTTDAEELLRVARRQVATRHRTAHGILLLTEGLLAASLGRIGVARDKLSESDALLGPELHHTPELATLYERVRALTL